MSCAAALRKASVASPRWPASQANWAMAIHASKGGAPASKPCWASRRAPSGSFPFQAAYPARNSVEPHGAWSAGLQKARLYDLILQDILLGQLAPMQALEENTLAAR